MPEEVEPVEWDDVYNEIDSLSNKFGYSASDMKFILEYGHLAAQMSLYLQRIEETGGEEIVDGRESSDRASQ